MSVQTIGSIVAGWQPGDSWSGLTGWLYRTDLQAGHDLLPPELRGSLIRLFAQLRRLGLPQPVAARDPDDAGLVRLAWADGWKTATLLVRTPGRGELVATAGNFSMSDSVSW